MKDDPNISIIIPVYNSIMYLKKCLDSIVQQSYRNFQIVIVDDGSTDGSEKVCDKYAETDNRFKVIHQKNAGSVNARKKGLVEAKGDYIYYMDSDDWIDTNFIETFVDIIIQHKVDMIAIGCKREYENGKSSAAPIPFEQGFYDKAQIKNKILPQLVYTDNFFGRGLELTYWSYLISKELLIKNMIGVDERIRIGDDVACMYLCWLDVNKIYLKKDLYYHHRQRKGSLRSIDSPEEYKNLQLLYEILVNRFIKEENKDDLLKSAKYLIMFCLLFSGLIKMEAVDGLFPYTVFPEGSRVIVYGAGIFGTKVVKALLRSRYANIVAWLDENFLAHQNEEILVEAPEKLIEMEYDYIILGVIRSEIRENIRKILETKYKISGDKIIDIDLKKLDNAPLPKEFEDILYQSCMNR